MTVTAAPPISARPSSQRRRRWSLFRALLKRPAGAVAIGLVLVTIVVALAAPWLAPHDPNAIDVTHILKGPSATHWLGTDYVGRDILSGVIYGARSALEISIPAVVIGFFPGLLLGLSGGFLGGLVDKLAILVMDSIHSVPALVLALVVLTLFGHSNPVVTTLIAVTLVPGYARLARAQTLAAKQNVYVKAERALGASSVRIALRHITPNILPPLIVLMALDIPGAIGIEAGLAFLGIGVQPPTSDWGVMLNNGFQSIRTSPWGMIGPMIALLIVTGAFTTLGETLRDVVDPKLVGVRRRRRRSVLFQKARITT